MKAALTRRYGGKAHAEQLYVRTSAAFTTISYQLDFVNCTVLELSINIYKNVGHQKKSIVEFIMSNVRSNNSHEEPNPETQKAMREVNERKNLTSCNSIEEFWKIVRIDPNA